MISRDEKIAGKDSALKIIWKIPQLQKNCSIRNTE
jgi:hypothetical protein